MKFCVVNINTNYTIEIKMLLGYKLVLSNWFLLCRLHVESDKEDNYLTNEYNIHSQVCHTKNMYH